MHVLVLYHNGEPVREFRLGPRPLEVGSGVSCDIVVSDSDVADRHMLVREQLGRVVVHYLAGRGAGRAQQASLAAGQRLPLGKHYALASVVATPAPSECDSRTSPLGLPLADPCCFSLVVGHGPEARRCPVDAAPLHVGSAHDNDVVLADRAASAHHLRLEPMPAGVLVRDLGSRNGTYVDGLRVDAAQVSGPSRLRVGHTDIWLVPSEPSRLAHEDPDPFVCASSSMGRVLCDVERFARLSWPVLVTGETGVGKERIARALHARGPRARGPFVALNAGGFTRELVDSELFGHEKGAFTGADRRHAGAFEQASGGTLFLDEIGELPIETQARLLRVLETWQVRRVGSESQMSVDVRLTCATHRDLRAMLARGSFRHDLYYRLTRLVLEVPPLRDRPEDVRVLAEHFLDQAAGELGHRTLTAAAEARLVAHHWPGNARELRNVVSMAAAESPGETLDAIDIERALLRLAGPGFARGGLGAPVLLDVLAQHRGNQASTARALGIARSTLRDRLRRASAEGT